MCVFDVCVWGADETKMLKRVGDRQEPCGTSCVGEMEEDDNETWILMWMVRDERNE